MGRPQRRVSKILTFAAPTGGINDLDPVANMPPQYCLDLINLFPTTANLRVRRGFRKWCTGLGDKVYTVMPYTDASGEVQMFACTNDGIYDVTSSSESPPKVANISKGIMNHTQFSNVAGNYLIACNGVDAVWQYDGTTWLQWIEDQTAENPGEIKGVDPSVLFGVLSYKTRLWFIQKDSMIAWYLDTDSVGGQAYAFRVGGQFGRGGALYQLANWSLDSGAGLDDKLMMQTSRGEIAIYTGSDPASASTWSLDSVYFAAAPVGTNATSELGGDVLLLTTTGLIPLSVLVQGKLDVSAVEGTLSKRISSTLNQIIHSISYVPDWEIHNIPSVQATIIVIPSTSETEAIQFVMNNLTGAWTKFDLPIRSLSPYHDAYMFGTDEGTVCIAGDSLKDNTEIDGTGGTTIYGGLVTAFNYMEDPTTNKHFKLVRPIFDAGSPPSFLLKVNTDYDRSPIAGNPADAAGNQGEYLWNTAEWDDAFWESSTGVYRPWVGVLGIGFCASVLMKITAEEFTSISAFEVAFEPGNSI